MRLKNERVEQIESWIDAHCHLWELTRGDYGWLDVNDPKFQIIAKDFLPEDMQQAMRNTSVTHSILVQAAPTDAETDYLLSIANKSEAIIGVVGWVDLALASTEGRLETLSRQPKLLGIRPMLQDIDDTNWILKPELQPGLTKLIELDLCFDALVTPRHMSTVLNLCQRYPDLRIIADHAAKPNLSLSSSDSQRLQWEQGMRAIAEETNAFCKLSGLLTEMSKQQVSSKENALAILKPVFDQLLSWFGPRRLVWGSDWPVLTLATNADIWYEITTTLLSDLSIESQRDITCENAKRFYLDK